MKLEDLPGGERIFVDAIILIYHFTGISSPNVRRSSNGANPGRCRHLLGCILC
jgi:hypothetical protein